MSEPVPFCGGSDELKRKKADVQRAVNLMPTPLEAGQNTLYLAPVPGLVEFLRLPGSPTPPPPPPPPGTVVFMDDFISNSCNYGFFERPSGGFLLVTDTFGLDRVPGSTGSAGFYLKLVEVDAAGEVTGFTTSAVYATLARMTTYHYGGLIYAGAVVEIATGERHLISINPDTLAVVKVFAHSSHLWEPFNRIADPSKVLINALVGVTVSSSVAPHIVVDLLTGLVVQTLNLPFVLTADNIYHHAAQSAVSTSWFVKNFAGLLECDTTTGAVLNTYTNAALFGAEHELDHVQLAGGELVLFAVKTTGAAQLGLVGVFNETSETFTGGAEYVGFMLALNPVVYEPVRDSIYFVATEETVQARVYGYSLTTLAMNLDEALALGFVDGQDISYGTANFTGSVGSDGSIYLSAFTGFVDVDGKESEQYKVFRFNPP